MSEISAALETQIIAIRALQAEAEGTGTEDHAAKNDKRSLRQGISLDRHYRVLLDLLASRIRYFTRQYGLVDMADDAEQACAIAIHRAVAEYDPCKARFTTFVNWKIRGELQALRHRMRLDQRSGARAVGAHTLSLDMMMGGTDGEGEGSAFTVVDDSALERAESGAAARMAGRLTDVLLDDYVAHTRQQATEKALRSRKAIKPGTIAPDQVDAMEAKLRRERSIVASHLTGRPDQEDDGSLSSEQIRQVTRRVLRHVEARVKTEPKFAAAMGTVH